MGRGHINLLICVCMPQSCIQFLTERGSAIVLPHFLSGRHTEGDGRYGPITAHHLRTRAH